MSFISWLTLKSIKFKPGEKETPLLDAVLTVTPTQILQR